MAAYAVHSQTTEAPARGNLSREAGKQAAAIPDFVELVQTVKPAVVSVRVKSDSTPQILSDGGFAPFEGNPFERFFRDFPNPGSPFGDRPRRFSRGQGSGFLVSADGYIVTNNHVIANAQEVEIVMDDGTTLHGKVVGTDNKTDLALLKVDGRTDFPFVKFAEVKPKIGEWVVAMGNPFGLGGTVTAGIVSAQGRNIGAGPYDDFLQIDAAVNRGNSGGPTFNMNGRVIGVNTAIYSPSGGSVGIAFDIPATTAKWVTDELKDDGSVERGWLGVKVQAVTRSIADSLGLKEAEGALVAQAEADSPAAKAGLRPGDVITSIDGAAVKNPRDLARKIAATAPEATITVGYIRDGKGGTVQATVTQMRGHSARRTPAQARQSDKAGKLGLNVAPASEIEGAGNDGLAVLQVDPAGKAAELGFAAGDVIVKAGAHEVDRVSDLDAAMEAAAAGGRSSMLLLIKRGDSQRYVAVPVSIG
jgi:serine protease Do